MIQTNRKSIWYPKYIAYSVTDLDAAELKRNSITHLVFDLDNTLVQNHADFMTPAYIRYVNSLRSSGFTLMLASNRRRNVDVITKSIDAIAVRPHGLSMKPFKSYYDDVRDLSDTTPTHIAMIGDHIVNDVIGANRIGFTTIMIVSANKMSYLNHMYIRYVRKHYVS